jgi:GxxExxY protein
MGLKFEEVTRPVIGAFYEVQNVLGVGFLEAVYREALAVSFAERGLPFEREMPFVVTFRDRPVGVFKPDFVVASRVIVEAKSARIITNEHRAQLLNYLRASEIEVGILLNFSVKPTFERFVYSNARKQPPAADVARTPAPQRSAITSAERSM